MKNYPPFDITPEILTLVSKIERLLGQVDASNAIRPEPRLRKENRIRTIKDSLAIEGNTLSFEQVSAIFDNKRVTGPKREIREVKNAIIAYEMAPTWKAAKEQDFKSAHKALMTGLIQRAGMYRTSGVGIFKGDKVSHIAPQAKLVSALMDKLFDFLGKKGGPSSPLVTAAVAHYEIEFIHPFEDGNGRMGRLWQHVILAKYHPAFEVVPVESLIKENQSEYYESLEKSDKSGRSTPFIEYSLKLLVRAVEELLAQAPKRRSTLEERLLLAQGFFESRWFLRRDYIKLFPGISLPTSSRDLDAGVKSKILLKRGEHNKTEYRFAPPK